MPDATVFFADVLGFAAAIRGGDVDRASQALDDIALLFSGEDEITRYLHRDEPWTHRFALSDSIALVSGDPAEACRAAARFFFRLAWLNHASPDETVLMRGALTCGPVVITPGVFPESGAQNLLGEAVVAAVLLEKSGAKGPRLLVDTNVARTVSERFPHMLGGSVGRNEILWLLHPVIDDLEPTMLAVVCRTALDLFLDSSGEALPHLLGYLDLVFQSLQRLREVDAGKCQAIVASLDLDGACRRLSGLPFPEAEAIRRRLAALPR